MTILQAKIANLIIKEGKASELQDNVIEFHVAQYRCMLTIDDEVLKWNAKERNLHRGFCIETGHLDIHGLSSNEEAETVLTDICWLLAFITLSNVSWSEYTYEGLGRKISIGGNFYNYGRSVITVHAKYAVKNFMESSWAGYQELKENRKLPAIIHYLLESNRPNLPLEAQFICAAIALESLKSTYASSKGYDRKGSVFLKPTCVAQESERIEGAKGAQLRMSFETLLLEMFAEVGMKPTLEIDKDIEKDKEIALSEIVKLRNEIFHNGLAESNHRYVMKICDKAQDYIIGYLLRIIGYSH